MKDGGTAFPQGIVIGNPNTVYGPTQACGGMSLRDYFAAAALQGAIANGRKGADPTDIARGAYIVADAMLAEREKDGH